MTHEVVKGETLWALAERYLGNPYRWPLIFEANQGQIQDPDLIQPGQVFVIPSAPGAAVQVRGVEVVTREGAEPLPEPVDLPSGGQWVQAGARVVGGCPGPENRTIFYSGQGDPRRCPPILPPTGDRTAFYRREGRGAETGGMTGGERESEIGGESPADFHARFAVPYGLVYGADWLDQPGEGTSPLGTLIGIYDAHAGRTPRGPARKGEKVLIARERDSPVKVGDLLQTFRPARKERRLGEVQRPSGILVATEVTDAEIRATVSAEFDRVWIGDLVRFAPDYAPREGVFPVPVESNVTAVVLGFPEERPVQGFGATVFLDVGVEEGIAVGDIFQGYVEEPGPLLGVETATLQVVFVSRTGSTARVIGVDHSGLGSGDLVRLVAKVD